LPEFLLKYGIIERAILLSKVSPFSSFRLEDFPTQKEWISTLFLPLNSVLSQLTQALNGQVELGDNIPSFTKVLSGSNLSLPLSFQVDGGFTPSQMIVAQAFKAGAPIAMVGAWSQSGDTLTVSKLFEVTEDGNVPLASGTKYSISLRFN
jgi:hypothetical protein